jgi:hypothetical protein
MTKTEYRIAEIQKLIASLNNEKRKAIRLRARQLCLQINQDLRNLQAELDNLQAGA